MNRTTIKKTLTIGAVLLLLVAFFRATDTTQDIKMHNEKMQIIENEKTELPTITNVCDLEDGTYLVTIEDEYYMEVRESQLDLFPQDISENDCSHVVE